MAAGGKTEQISREFVADRCRLMAFIHSMVKDHHTAEDIFQEVWLRFHRAIEADEEIQDTAKWCRGTARNLVLHHWRSRSRSRVVANSELLDRMELAFEEQDSSREFWQQREEALRHCLDGLPEKSRTVLAMKYDSQLTAEAVGSRLGKSPGAIMVMLTRLRQALEECVTARMQTGALSE